MLRRVALVRTDVSEELSAFIIRVTRIGKLGTTLARCEEIQSRLLQEPHGVTSKKTEFFIGSSKFRTLMKRRMSQTMALHRSPLLVDHVALSQLETINFGRQEEYTEIAVNSPSLTHALNCQVSDRKWQEIG
jgi:hypothetical protein